MMFLRSALYNIGFVIETMVIGLIGMPTLLVSRKAVVRFSRLWGRVTFAWLRWTVGLEYEVRGREYLPTVPSILALKHQSAWDTIVIGQLLADPAIVYKRELQRIPIFGWYLWGAGMIAIDREAGSAALKHMVNAAKQAIAMGRSVAIFPEGTRGPVGSKLPYLIGVGALYSQLGVPMIPVALNSGFFWGRQAFLKRPGRIVIEILPPIPPGLDRRQAMATLEAQIEENSARLLAEAGYRPFVDNSGGNPDA
jgi:1-acyl-sn-glycerol-3-phosphate acyltransferase